MDFNPYMAKAHNKERASGGGKGYIEAADDAFMNIVWQNRAAPPSEYETTLCNTLSGIFAGGATDIGDVVKALNDTGIKPAVASQWTEENFAAEMRKLGA